MHRLVPLVLVLLTAASGFAAPFETVLKTANTTDKYLFYLHGAILEETGKNGVSPRYGPYLYDNIVKEYEDRGLVVIEEVRGRVNPYRYADRIIGQIRRLKAAGVPPDNITVAGFSKGGHIALLIASSLGDPAVGFVIMAGCGHGQGGYLFDQFLKRKRGARLKGRLYSIYAGSDMVAGSCRQATAQSSGKGLTFRETRIKSNKGHGLFYQPRPEWIQPTAIFAKGGR
ncbi:hypothetical protein GM415_05870 [Pseudodesulfovibrio cashew]|uniref:Alpha/beta hydrolase n=1 Tax=Pseudodesulfovibrio cashew TaxID=2678688 RepID=A0A6I6JGM6_9BACT|nr:hypothetical protein [Pseudodesulfovibrio cashew]QGY39663.1 hypothetical protein GM415_05870 [Pseudodesulfovibrio cashew]